jgi:hypothetical protein
MTVYIKVQPIVKRGYGTKERPICYGCGALHNDDCDKLDRQSPDCGYAHIWIADTPEAKVKYTIDVLEN